MVFFIQAEKMQGSPHLGHDSRRDPAHRAHHAAVAEGGQGNQRGPEFMESDRKGQITLIQVHPPQVGGNPFPGGRRLPAVDQAAHQEGTSEAPERQGQGRGKKQPGQTLQQRGKESDRQAACQPRNHGEGEPLEEKQIGCLCLPGCDHFPAFETMRPLCLFREESHPILRDVSTVRKEMFLPGGEPGDPLNILTPGTAEH